MVAQRANSRGCHQRRQLTAERDTAVRAVLNYDEEQPFRQLVRLAQRAEERYELVLDPTGKREKRVCNADELVKGIPLEIPPQGLATLAVTRIH